MIVFLESTNSKFTINLDINATQIRLLKCSVYNSWYNLVGCTMPNKKSIPDSHYTPETLSTELKKAGYILTAGLPHESTLYKRGSGTETLNKDLKLFDVLHVDGANPQLVGQTPLNYTWKIPPSYEIHCDRVESAIFNGILKYKGVLDVFKPTGMPFDLVQHKPNFPVWHKLKDHTSALTFEIKHGNKPIDFKGRTINLQIELI